MTKYGKSTRESYLQLVQDASENDLLGFSKILFELELQEKADITIVYNNICIIYLHICVHFISSRKCAFTRTYFNS